MKLKLFAIIILLLSGCLSPKVVQKETVIYKSYETNCNLMISTIKENIIPSLDKKKCLTYNDTLIERLRVNTECFFGYSKEELIKLFGKPSLETPTQSNYLFYPDCGMNYEVNTFFYRLNFHFICENQPSSNVTHSVISKEKVIRQ